MLISEETQKPRNSCPVLQRDSTSHLLSSYTVYGFKNSSQQRRGEADRWAGFSSHCSFWCLTWNRVAASLQLCWNAADRTSGQEAGCFKTHYKSILNISAENHLTSCKRKRHSSVKKVHWRYREISFEQCCSSLIEFFFSDCQNRKNTSGRAVRLFDLYVLKQMLDNHLLMVMLWCRHRLSILSDAYFCWFLCWQFMLLVISWPYSLFTSKFNCLISPRT